jgi:hypothetical protein
MTNEPEAVTVEAETLPALTAPVTDAEAAVTAPVTLTLSNSGSAKATPTALVLGISIPL